MSEPPKAEQMALPIETGEPERVIRLTPTERRKAQIALDRREGIRLVLRALAEEAAEVEHEWQDVIRSVARAHNVPVGEQWSINTTEGVLIGPPPAVPAAEKGEAHASDTEAQEGGAE